MLGGDFYDTAIRSLSDQGITVFQTLRGADKRAIKFITVCRAFESRQFRCKFPNNLEGNRINLQYTGVISEGVIMTGWGAWVRDAVSGPTTIVKNKNISFTGKSPGDHMGMVLTDNPS